MSTIILVFELENVQEQYAKLMNVIRLLEIESNGDEIDVNGGKMDGGIRYCWLKDMSLDKLRKNEIVQGVERQRMDNNINSVWKLHKITDVRQVIKEKEKYEIGYYVCIKTGSEADIKNIQYFVLMLQQFSKIKNRIWAFLEPITDYYKKTEGAFSLYYKYSHYLRFVTSNYDGIFWSAFYESNMVKIRRLSGKKSGVQSTFFPLLEINSNTLTLLSGHCFLNNQGLLENEKRGEKITLFDIVEISQKMFEKNLNKKSNDLQESIHIKNKIYSQLAKEGTTPLEYVILATLLLNTKISIEEEVWNCLKRAKSIASGLIQLIENVVLHSENHIGTFTLRVIDNSKNYLREMLEDNSKLLSSNILEIDICDANMNHSLISNFMNKLPDDCNYFDEIQPAISHFFDEYEEEKEQKAWLNYRRDFPVRCLGLSRLGLELRLCEALLMVRSSTRFRDNIKQLEYRANYCDGSSFERQEGDWYIPGTQFQIILPMFLTAIEKAHNSNLFLNSIGNIVENDKTYASFLDYKAEQIDLERVLQGAYLNKKKEDSTISVDEWIYRKSNETIEENPKNEWVNRWTNAFNYWGKMVDGKEEKVYYVDMRGIEEIESLWGVEPFCKGLVQSEVLADGKVKYLVLINCRNEYLSMMFNTIILAKKKLHEETQLFLQSENMYVDLLIAGGSKDEIVRNAIQYAYFRGNIPEFLQKENKRKYVRNGHDKPVVLFPYDVFINTMNDKKTLFEKYIEKIADNLITTTDQAGYLLNDVHMRLGNKVHLEKFYEISILFRKHRVAKKLALLLLKDMLEKGIELSENLLFYGYASYSRAILVALVEIVKEYRGKVRSQGENQKEIQDGVVEFAVYQNDIQVQKSLMDISPKVKMYYGNSFNDKKEMRIVQIVPISSTLTTFKKMWDVFPQKEGNCLLANYTLFWVRDEESEDGPSIMEKKYLEEVKEDFLIKTNLISPYPRFFCSRRVKWNHPLNCKWCYPDELVDERALIETDVTSTVPSQQLEVNLRYAESRDVKNLEHNEKRLIALEGCVYYGHICRDNNHFQYYIDTNQYFIKQKNEVAEWLKEQRAETLSVDNKQEMTDVMNIIFTPQHHTNVEFCYYVNNYFFNGAAEVITIDSTKEYRSNIVAKYADVKCAIAMAKKLHTKVMFNYVDDTIITGNTFRRVNSLVHSLVPDDDVQTLQFDRVFVLINRLSRDSKKEYSDSGENSYLAYVDINVSSVRSFGDSCAMCTLENNSKLFARRASTIALNGYWEQKRNDYRKIYFDKYIQTESLLKTGYFRLLCSHYAKSTLHMGQDRKKNVQQLINLILGLNNEYYNPEGKVSLIYEEVLKRDVRSSIEAFLKILCRPFFSYGKMYRQAALDLFIMLAQCFIAPDFLKNLKGTTTISSSKEYLNDEELKNDFIVLYEFICRHVEGEAEMVSFVLDFILESLADLRSNYLIRYETIKNVKKLIQIKGAKRSNYEKYERLIYRIINGSADETKSLWFEKLLYTGIENKGDMEAKLEMKVKKGEKEKEFSLFWDCLFINNTRLYYDSMLVFLDKAKVTKDVTNSTDEVEMRIKDAVDSLWDDYYIQNLRKFIKLEVEADNVENDESDLNDKIKDRVIKSAKLLALLKTRTANGIGRYQELKRSLEELLYQEDTLFILTKAMEENKYCLVTDYEKGDLSNKIISHINEALDKEQFEEKGFFVGDGYIIICIGNNCQCAEREKYPREKKKMEVQPLLFYVECDTTDNLRVKLRIRYLLMYRHQILKWVEADFNNNMMPNIVKEAMRNRQLVRDKAGDHSSRQDIAVNHRLLQSKLISKTLNGDDDNQKLYIWLLFRTYVNMRVARLFRSEWSGSSRDMIYARDKNGDKMNGPLKEFASSFFETRLGELSPKRYFEFVGSIFQFNININGRLKEDASIDEMKESFQRLYGRESDGYYYKEEFIICIVFDILFSALKNCRNWETGSAEFVDRKCFDNVFTDTDVTVAYYFHTRLSGEKCKICISIEDSDDSSVRYFVIRNRVYTIKDKDDLDKVNKKFQNELQAKETIGLSIQTIQWYTETLDSKSNVKARFEYVWNEESNEAEFVTKLPILKGEGK